MTVVAPEHRRPGQPAQTTLRTLVASDGTLVALRQNQHKVHVAVFGGRAPGMRAEQINFLRLKFSFQPLDDIFQKAGVGAKRAAWSAARRGATLHASRSTLQERQSPPRASS